VSGSLGGGLCIEPPPLEPARGRQGHLRCASICAARQVGVPGAGQACPEDPPSPSDAPGAPRGYLGPGGPTDEHPTAAGAGAGALSAGPSRWQALGVAQATGKLLGEVSVQLGPPPVYSRQERGLGAPPVHQGAPTGVHSRTQPPPTPTACDLHNAQAPQGQPEAFWGPQFVSGGSGAQGCSGCTQCTVAGTRGARTGAGSLGSPSARPWPRGPPLSRA